MVAKKMLKSITFKTTIIILFSILLIIFFMEYISIKPMLPQDKEPTHRMEQQAVDLQPKPKGGNAVLIW